MLACISEMKLKMFSPHMDFLVYLFVYFNYVVLLFLSTVRPHMGNNFKNSSHKSFLGHFIKNRHFLKKISTEKRTPVTEV